MDMPQSTRIFPGPPENGEGLAVLKRAPQATAQAQKPRVLTGISQQAHVLAGNLEGDRFKWGALAEAAAGLDMGCRGRFWC